MSTIHDKSESVIFPKGVKVSNGHFIGAAFLEMLVPTYRFLSNNAPVCSAMSRADRGISFLNHHSTAPTTAEPKN